MYADPSNVAVVNITIQDAAATRPNFGTMVVFAASPLVEPREYAATPTGLAAMLTDGFSVGSAAYILGSVIAAQDPGVESFWVYPRSAQNAQSIVLTPTVTTVGYVYSLTGTGTDGVAIDLSYTVQSGDDATDICTAIDALIDGSPGLVGASGTVGTGTLTIAADVAGARFFLSDIDAAFTVDDPSVDAGIATDLAAALLAIDDFYGVVLDSSSAAEIAAASAWCETNQKMLAAWSLDSDIAGSGSSDIASTLKTAARAYTYVGPTRDGLYPDAVGLMARQFSRDVGSSNWANQALSLCTPTEWSATELGYIRGKNALAYVTILGLPMTLDGKAASGRFLDLTRNKDWLKANLQADIVTAFANNEIIPYTPAGMAILENAIGARLSNAFDLGVVANDWSIDMPALADVPSADRTARLLQNVKWYATVQGAINKLIVDGTITI